MRSKTDPVDQPERTAHYDCAMCTAEMLHSTTMCQEKKVNHYINFHNSGKQCWILEKFCNMQCLTANKMLNFSKICQRLQ